MYRYLICIVHLTDGPGTYVLDKQYMPASSLSDQLDHNYLLKIPWNNYRPKMTNRKYYCFYNVVYSFYYTFFVYSV